MGLIYMVKLCIVKKFKAIVNIIMKCSIFYFLEYKQLENSYFRGRTLEKIAENVGNEFQ